MDATLVFAAAQFGLTERVLLGVGGLSLVSLILCVFAAVLMFKVVSGALAMVRRVVIFGIVLSLLLLVGSGVAGAVVMML